MEELLFFGLLLLSYGVSTIFGVWIGFNFKELALFNLSRIITKDDQNEKK